MRPRTTGQVALPTGLVQAYREVTVASIADVLWEQGISAHLPHQIKPIFPLEADAIMAEALGPVILPEFLKVKRSELAAYDLHVHPWERRTYLEAI